MNGQKKKDGITLIALIITIIVLLILAGVSISLVVGENGILNKAQSASEKTKFASEKEAIEFVMSDIKTGLMIGEEIPSEKYLGDKLSEMSAVTGDWKNVTIGETTYKDGWYMVEKGENISGYGKTKLNWLINYDTGEIIELKDGEYTVANANASGAIVDDTLKLNIDPVNLQDPSKWGTGVSFHSGNESSESGVKETEIKFDGENNYLIVKNANINESNGITFEFYGKNYGTIIYPLCKTVLNEDGSINLNKGSIGFRIQYTNNYLGCCFGTGDSKSDKKDNFESEMHWMKFRKMKVDENNEYDYFSITLDFQNEDSEEASIILYKNGEFLDETTCSKEYLKRGDIFKNDIAFTIGCIGYSDNSTRRYIGKIF